MTLKPIQILYIQHAASIGGSAISLLLTLKALDRNRFVPVVGLIRPSHVLHSLYNDIGIKTVDMSDISTYEHTTGISWRYLWPPDWIARLRQRLRIGTTIDATRRHVQSLRPALVHLNSVVLLPSAIALSGMGIPFVWHVREHPVDGLLGARRRFLRNELLSSKGNIIFLSAADRRAWIGDSPRGDILFNYTDFHADGYAILRREQARSDLNLPPNVPIVLFVGGIAAIKGTILFLKAMERVLGRIANMKFFMPLAPEPEHLPLSLRILRAVLPCFGLGTYSQRVRRLLQSQPLSQACMLLPVRADIQSLYDACDVVVFPHTVPHFPRPVIEAAAASKPVVASDLEGMREVVLDGETGYLTRPGDYQSIADAVIKLLEAPEQAVAFGKKAYNYLKPQCHLTDSVKLLESIYARSLFQARGEAIAASPLVSIHN